MDRCFPQILMAENRWRHTNHWCCTSTHAQAHTHKHTCTRTHPNEATHTCTQLLQVQVCVAFARRALPLGLVIRVWVLGLRAQGLGLRA
jgi:hypothetical protein